MVKWLFKWIGLVKYSANYSALDFNDNLQTENDRPVFTVAQK